MSVLLHCAQPADEPRSAGWTLSGVLVLLTIPVTVYQVRMQAHGSKHACFDLCCSRCDVDHCFWFAHHQYVSELSIIISCLVHVPNADASHLQIALHVKHYNAPELQRHVVRIICMVPIYALVSWLSLRFASARRWLSPLRECYESVVLYSFLQYLVGCLQRKTGNYSEWLVELPPQEPMWPLHGWLGRAIGVKTIHNGADFMHAMRQVRGSIELVAPTSCQR
jgi:Organic solute transporter Ostalpha